MSADLLNVFLTNYIMSLSERTRFEKNDVKTGFDWVIYNIGLAKDWNPIRLPFIRQQDALTGLNKTEAEFGIDMSFITPTKEEIIIFVLKAKPLKNSTWISDNFDSDIRMASTPDIKSEHFSTVNKIKIILAYNKDEDAAGIELYNRLVVSFGDKIGDDISVSYERWNLTKIVEEVKLNLLSPNLLPQHLAELFRYICSQVSDFSFKTAEWENQLIPNWQNFLLQSLSEPLNERKLRLVPVSLLILKHYKKDSPDSEAGWIDLIEWAMLHIWNCYKLTEHNSLKEIILKIWVELYIAELERYIVENELAFTTDYGFHIHSGTMLLDSINDAYVAFWHLGRLGILTMGPQVYAPQKDNEKAILDKWILRSANWLTKCLRVNPASHRPLIDINHIELFLIWFILWQSNRPEEIYAWLSELEGRLVTRRFRNSEIPFIEGSNNLDNVVDYLITKNKPIDFIDNSSYLLLMLLEICFSLPNGERDEILQKIYKRLIQGLGDDGKPLADFEIDLIGWAPPKDWSRRILKETVDDGVAITTDNFKTFDKEEKPLSDKIIEFVEKSREKFAFEMPSDIPMAVYILACLKHQSPLPSEFWRQFIFHKEKE